MSQFLQNNYNIIPNSLKILSIIPSSLPLSLFVVAANNGIIKHNFFFNKWMIMT